MSNIVVNLTLAEIHNACRIYAVTRVLNEGKAVSSEMEYDRSNGSGDAPLSGIAVVVECESQSKSVDTCIVDAKKGVDE